MKLSSLALSISLASALASSGCATTESKDAAQAQAETKEQTIQKNDYPTRDRVEYVFNCVAQHGGLTFITQYACGCKIDKIAEKLTFAEYEAARTYTQLKNTPGEAGSIFRDPKQSKDLRKQLKEAEAYAEKQCFVK